MVTWGDDFGTPDAGPSGGQLSPSHGEQTPEQRNHSGHDVMDGQREPGKGILQQVAPLMRYYIEAFKSGSYPSVARDDVFLWVQAHLQKRNCSGLTENSGPRDRAWVRLMPYSSVCS